MIESVPNEQCPGVAGDVAANIPIDELSLFIETPDTKDYVLAYDIGFGGKVASLRIRSALGAGHVTLRVNDAPVGGMEGVAFNHTDRPEYTGNEENTFSVGDDIVLSIDDLDPAAASISVTLILNRTT